MAVASREKSKPPSEIDNFDDIDFQDEVEIICNFLRWDSFPKSGTENFKRLLEKRAQHFCVEAYIPIDDASPALQLPWQLFYTGSPESTGDEQVEYLQEVGEPLEGQSEGCKRLVIPHPRQQRYVLSKVHKGKEGTGVHLTGYEMWEEIVPVYYWRHIRTSIIDFLKNCETCKLQDPGTGPGTSPGTDLGTSGSNVNNDGFTTVELNFQDEDEAFESFQLSNEIPYHEEVDQVYNYLKKGKYPANTTINLKRTLRRKAQQYVLGDDDADETTNGASSRKLYFLKAHERRARSDAGAEGQEGEDVCRRRVIPMAGEQQRILEVVHIGPSGEHCGRDKMLSSISQDYFWKGIYQSVVSYLESCSECRTKRSDAKRKSLNQQNVKKTPTTKQATKKVKRERVMTRSCTQAYNSLATQKEHFIRRTMETYNYLKDRSYPLNSTPDAKRDIRRRAHCFTIGQSEVEEWPEIYGHSEPEERLYYLKKMRRQGGQEEDEEEDGDDDQGQEEKQCRRLVVTTEEEQNVAIMKVHVDENGIHISRTRTYSRLAELYYWVDMKTSVKKYIDDCPCPLPSNRRVPEDQQTGDSLVLKKISIKPPKVSPAPPPVKKEEPLLPPEFTELPSGLSHIARINTEVEALIVYLYLKWQKYPPGCTIGFKRMVRKKARSFCFQEDGGDDGDKTWCLFYKGDSNRGPSYTGQVMEAQETTGDATDIERAQVRKADGIAEPMERAESTGTEQSEEMGKAVQTSEIVESEVTPESDTVSPKVPVVIRKENSMDYRTRNRLFVFRKADQEKILQLLHLNGGKNGEHAGRDRIYNMIGRHFFWRGIRDHIQFIIMKCKRCHRRKTAGKSTDYALYLQDLYNKSNEDAFDEDLSSHQLPQHIQTYLENALRMEAEWEAEDHRQGTIVNSNGSFTEADQAVHGLVKDRATEQSRLADGGSLSFCRHPCDSCPRRFRDRDSLRRHKWAQHIGRSSVECTVCGKKTKDLHIHMRCHTKERPLECEVCNKRFRYRGGLTHHRKIHVGLRPFSCPECPQRYVSRSDLNNHFKSCHEGSGEYQCEVCGNSFVTQMRLDKHKKLHVESRERFICNICGKVLASAFTLKFHMHIHTGERQVLCEVCGKGFKKKCDLSKHMNHHMGIKPHHCHLCQQRFCLKSDLQDHVRGHEGASLYQCDLCHKKFKNKRSMARCKRRHAAQASAAEEGFQCNTCGDVMGTLVDFSKHMEAHVGEQVIQLQVEIE